VRFRNLFKSKWRRRDSSTVAKTRSARKLRKLADQIDDERIRLEAARRLNDATVLKALARTATQESVRMDAAILVHDQPCLTAIALKAWDIQLGMKAVGHIQNRMLLRRVAQSAQQDAIRLTAALRLEDTALLKQVARSSNHVDVHWQVAQFLNDPCLLADIVMFKPGNIRLEPLRRKARHALMNQLDLYSRNMDHSTLLAVIQSLTNPTFKLEAFVRLPSDHITKAVLDHIAIQDLRYIPKELSDRMLTCIQTGGWQVDLSVRHSTCIFCRGTGQLSLKCISANDTWGDYDIFPCPDCRGLGKTPFRQAACTRPDGAHVAIRLPA
jgi:hypothetical protein